MSDCLNCSEYDKEKHFCPKWCDVIKSTIEDARADERRKFAEWLQENVFISNGYVFVKEKMYTRVITFIELLDMYEKEMR